MTDLLLAIAHHVLAIGLVAMLASELVMLRAAHVDVKRLVALDARYGISAGLLVVVGLCRVFFGAKGWDFYESNPWFWAKIAAFILIALLSLPATIRFFGWRKALIDNPHFIPTDLEVAKVRRLVGLEVGLILVILVCAAAMARYGQF